MATDVQAQPASENALATTEVLGQNGVNKEEQKNENKPRPKPQRFKRPDYNTIHSKPLPLEVYPLPAFIPHNPLSVVRIAIALISHSIRPPSSNEKVHLSYFSPETQSVHVTDAESIKALWERGFFGAGSLSRSEPRWLDQEKRKRGLEASQTSEERTRKVREDRRQFKLQRAKEQAQAREEQLRREGKIVNEENLASIVASEASQNADAAAVVPLDNSGAQPGDHDVSENPGSKEESLEAVRKLEEELASIEDQEHLQLTLEEAFFLTYALGALKVFHSDTPLESSSALFRHCCSYTSDPLADNAISVPIAPDNDFVMRYAVYHHFRSLGWVVRSGIKFAVDFLLYNRGPAFAHAEFSIMIIPSYTNSYWSETEDRLAECRKKEHRDWWWLHRVNRVQTQVFKTLMLVYVDVPPPWDLKAGGDVDIGSVLSQYKIREFMIKRWTPNRNRN
ncbi:hypothetical protein BU24DRAFT_446312 [Aaosphaeria arxii CBS 175.79]|uniref:tRNA-splicing endonuclease subunit Sen2 n=1 Tax=Aaosphaeria arxii CBS 175.79 TaxID=1450172 RepID=A0A6A5Y9I6_9PLEO|nr:uncharacterized protein BU24DRAFT_446312 [Aaosphaeria arxii CBS 175.79]KAF2021254.1 hypothetical protein BU24DRAFT_446312 [Aaosphaeria arxii CBS 175.79]